MPIIDDPQLPIRNRYVEGMDEAEKAAEIRQLRAERERLWDQLGQAQARIETDGRELERLRAENEQHLRDTFRAFQELDRLRAALKPFAELAGKLDGAPNLVGLLTADDFERAKSAYEQRAQPTSSPKCPGCGAVVQSYCQTCQRQLES